MLRYLVPVLFPLAACAAPADQPGQIIAFNGASVTIRGGGDFSLANAGNGFTPGQAIVAQAADVCPRAKFVSGVGVDGPAWLVDYLFICP